MVLDAVIAGAIGVGIGLSLAAPPGPVNALIASHGMTRSWRAGFLVGCGAMTADAFFLALSAVARSAVESFAASWFPWISALGAAVLAYFAIGAVRTWRTADGIVEPVRVGSARSYATCLVTNLTSPYPLLWWLTAGVVLAGQLGLVLLVGFFLGILLWISAFPWSLRAAQRRFARTYRVVLAFSILCLAAFAAYLACPRSTRSCRSAERGEFGVWAASTNASVRGATSPAEPQGA